MKVKLEDDAVGAITPVLRPCPFCGGEAELREEQGVGSYTLFYVSCESDDCRVIVETRNSVSATKWGAIEAWNRRAADG